MRARRMRVRLAWFVVRSANGLCNLIAGVAGFVAVTLSGYEEAEVPCPEDSSTRCYWC